MGQYGVSIADIARAAGVSHTTVSRALHESPLISEATRRRIQLLASEMGYTPNAIAQSLQTRQTRTIGLVVTSIADPFFSDIVKGIEEVTRVAGFSVFLSASHNDSDQEIAAIDTFYRRRVDGILIASSRTTNYQQHLDHIQVPTVLINSQAEAQTKLLHWVCIDDCKGAQLAVEHLLQLGHRSIGYLGVSSRPRSNQQRLVGYQNALEAYGVAYDAAKVVIAAGDEISLEDDVITGQTLLPLLLNAGVTAVFCYNDMIAIGVLTACREKGIAAPQQLSIIGFDDINITSYVRPPLTTIHQPRIQLGRLATHVILDLLNDRPGQNHLLLPTLVLRSSTAQLD